MHAPIDFVVKPFEELNGLAVLQLFLAGSWVSIWARVTTGSVSSPS